MLKWIRDFSQDLERTGLDTLAAILPWIAPVTTAYVTFGNVQTHLGFSEPMAWVMAAVTEGLGLVTIHTSYSLYIYGERNGRQLGPSVIASLAAGFYLLVIIVVNVILELGYVEPIKITAKALISLLSVVAGVILALRARHASRLLADDQDRAKSEADATAQAVAAERRAARQRENDADLRRIEAEERRLDKAAERAYKLEKLKIEIQSRMDDQLDTKKPSTSPISSTGNQLDTIGQPARIANVRQFRALMASSTNGERPTGPDDLTARFGVARTTARRWWGDYTAAQDVAPAGGPPDATAT